MKIDADKGFILNLIILQTLPADKVLLAYQPYKYQVEWENKRKGSQNKRGLFECFKRMRDCIVFEIQIIIGHAIIVLVRLGLLSS